jgi:hypothetical protein
VLTLSIVVVSESRNLRWIELQPLWYVLQCVATSAVGPSGEAHVAELERRIAGGTLSAQDLARIKATLLKYQSDSQRTWSPSLGRIIEQFQAKKQLTASEWQKYLMNGIEVSVKCRPTVASDEPFAGALLVRPARYGDWRGDAVITLDQVLAGSTPLPAASKMTATLDRWQVIRLPFDGEPHLANGSHELKVNYTIAISDSTLTFSRSQQRQATFEVGNDARSIEPFKLRGQARIQHAWTERSGGALEPPIANVALNSGCLNVVFLGMGQVSAREEAYAFDVIVRRDKKEDAVGQICWPAHYQRNDLAFPIVGLIGFGTFDVILKPSRSRALREVEAQRYCDTELVFTGVKFN